MDVTPVVPKDRKSITGYGGGGFKINQEFTEGSLIVFPDHTQSWNITAPEQITLESLQSFLEASPTPEILLLGTGKSMVFLALELREALKQKGIAVDTMDTGAACRTYNILMGEERRVAAALIAV